MDSERIGIIDFQGFLINKRDFIIKELCLLVNGQFSHYIFLPPYDFNEMNVGDQFQCKWVTNHHHKINWNDGKDRYSDIKFIINDTMKNVDKIYVKGCEKKKWLKELLIDKNIIIENIEDHHVNFKLRKDSYENYTFRCNQHNYGVCSCNNVYKIYQRL